MARLRKCMFKVSCQDAQKSGRHSPHLGNWQEFPVREEELIPPLATKVPTRILTSSYNSEERNRISQFCHPQTKPGSVLSVILAAVWRREKEAANVALERCYLPSRVVKKRAACCPTGEQGTFAACESPDGCRGWEKSQRLEIFVNLWHLYCI